MVETRESAREQTDDSDNVQWAEGARTLLLDTARRYHAVITYKEVYEEVQAKTGVETKQLLRFWITDVLKRVAKDCAERGEPNLTSLCVNSSGSVGDGYRNAVLATTGEEPADPDDHAAQARLECYTYFGAVDLPADGGVPALTVKLAAARSRTRKVAQQNKAILMCPTCFMAVPATRVCDSCGERVPE